MVIPNWENESAPRDNDKVLYREHPTVGWTIDRFTRLQRIATRYEKLASSYLAMVTCAMILEWLELGRRTQASIILAGDVGPLLRAVTKHHRSTHDAITGIRDR